MKRLATASALLLAVSGFGLVSALPAAAGVQAHPTLSLSHSPQPMTVGVTGTVTMTLTNTEQQGSEDFSYGLVDNVPSQLTIGDVTDPGDFGCEVNATINQVTCGATINLAAGATSSVTFQVTPTEAGTFLNQASYTYGPAVSARTANNHRSGLKPAGRPVGGTAQDSIRARAAVTPSPTPTPTHTPKPTPKPTPTPTHKPTHHPTPTPSASVKAKTASLPNTGSSDLGILALVGMALVAVGGVILAAVRSRRSGS